MPEAIYLALSALLFAAEQQSDASAAALLKGLCWEKAIIMQATHSAVLLLLRHCERGREPEKMRNGMEEEAEQGGSRQGAGRIKLSSRSSL